jgi:hypothetical protein
MDLKSYEDFLNQVAAAVDPTVAAASSTAPAAGGGQPSGVNFGIQ